MHIWKQLCAPHATCILTDFKLFYWQKKTDWQMCLVVCVFWISALKWLCWSHCYHVCWSDWLFKTHCLQHHAMSHPHNTHTLTWCVDTSEVMIHTISPSLSHTHLVAPHPWSWIWGDGKSDGDRASKRGRGGETDRQAHGGESVEFSRLPWRTSQYHIEHFAATRKES